jgi:hypothetical protein
VRGFGLDFDLGLDFGFVLASEVGGGVEEGLGFVFAVNGSADGVEEGRKDG